MHTNPAFRPDAEARARADAADRAFGVLTVVGPDGILASHVPIIVGERVVSAHLVRSNPIARLLRDGPVSALFVVSGPDGYISPDWYEEDDLVPTWNYVAIHLRGTLTAQPPEALRPHLEALSATLEAHLLPKKPWTMDKNRPETLDKLMRTLVPVEMTIDTVESTYKLNQNRSDTARGSAADKVAMAPLGHEAQALAAMMRDPPR